MTERTNNCGGVMVRSLVILGLFGIASLTALRTVAADEQAARTTLKKQAQALLGRLLEPNGDSLKR